MFVSSRKDELTTPPSSPCSSTHCSPHVFVMSKHGGVDPSSPRAYAETLFFNPFLGELHRVSHNKCDNVSGSGEGWRGQQWRRLDGER